MKNAPFSVLILQEVTDMETKIIFDLLFAQPIGNTKFHGGGEYIKTVFKALTDQFAGSCEIIACYDEELFIDGWLLDILQKDGILVKHVKNVADVLQIIRQESECSEVRFFAGLIYPYRDSDFPANVTCIGTCHGLRLLEKPYDRYAPLYIKGLKDIRELVKYTVLHKYGTKRDKAMYGNAIRRFDIITTDSYHSGYAIRIAYPEVTKSKSIQVCYPPIKYVPKRSQLELEAKKTCEPYIMMISADRWIKNSYRGIIAIDELYSRGFLSGIRTRVYGRLPKRIQRKLKCQECFDLFAYVSPEEMERAYQQCAVFFYPTLNEGFGSPPLEALRYGKTCVISNVCSLPEIYGKAVYYCNPYDIIEMQNRLLQAVENKIDLALIKNQFELIQSRQKIDLAELCKEIAGTTKYMSDS